MSAGKDDAAVANFMVLFHKLRDLTDDDPTGLEALAAGDEAVTRLCMDLLSAASSLSSNERRRRQLFAAPVDPEFIDAWRDYENRFAWALSGVFFRDLGLDLEGFPAERRSRFDLRWDNADYEAQEQATAIEAALDFAEEQASEGWRDFPESIEAGIVAWRRLVGETGFDLRSVFRRRELVPFVLVPRHVSRHHGETETLSLLTHLQQAHDAFVFGMPFAALALMRSVLEMTLIRHYQARGENLAERINNCQGLPPDASKPALHRLRRLANAILHFNDEGVPLPKDKNFEKEILSLLHVLRSLIEGAPTRPSR